MIFYKLNMNDQFIVKFMIDNVTEGYNVFNYIDKPDNNMNQLVAHVSKVLNKHIPATHFLYWLGMLGGYGFDLLAKIIRKKLTVSSVRVKKFCSTTEFDAKKAHSCGKLLSLREENRIG